jgi:hypothetical protein
MAAKTEVAYDEFVSKQGPQHGLVSFMRAVYPSLAELAQQQAYLFDTPDALDLLIRQIMAAPDVRTVHKLLEAGPQM